jgi:hypothetical protein
MRKLILILLLSIYHQISFGQQTLVNIVGWNAWVHLPSTYNSTNNYYPTIVFFPGLGEVGTDANALKSNGPSAYIEQGWNGNVLSNNSLVEFIVISLQPPAAYPRPVAVKTRIDTLISKYRIDVTRLNMTGLSHGGWVSNILATYKPTANDYSYMKLVRSIVDVEGVQPNDVYDATSPYPYRFTEYANYGGKELGFEQKYDDRDIQTLVNAMNAGISGSGIYTQTNFGNGGHCCWSSFYGGQGTQPTTFNLNGNNWTIYDWLANINKITLTPVNLIYFKISHNYTDNTFTWRVENESDIAYYAIEESDDGVNYKEITRTAATGGPNYTIKY